MDWSKVFEVSLGAVLAFIFGFFLQFWLVRRQERFQKKMLEHQLSFMERLERERAVQDEKANAARLATEAAIAGHQVRTLEHIARENRNHLASENVRLRSEIRSALRQP
jgi:hypothetical protein